MINNKNDKPFHSGKGCVYHGSVIFGEASILGNYVVIGYPKEARLTDFQENFHSQKTLNTISNHLKQTKIGHRCRIASRVTIYEGTQIENEVSIDDNCRLGYNCFVGDRSSLLYSAFICDRVKIGKQSIIAGFVGDGTVIGNQVTSMGKIVHEFSQPEGNWGIIEPSPVIEDRVVIGFDAVIIGGVTIGCNSYIAAGAIVTKDIPPRSMVLGTNQIIPWNEWRGKKLSKDFWQWKTPDPN